MLLEKIAYYARAADVVVLAGSLPRAVDADFYAEAIRELSRRRVRTVLDTEGEPLRLGVEAEPWLVSPNQREAESLVGQEFHDEEDFLMALDAVAELGARNVLIGHGAGAFALFREDRRTHALRGRASRGTSRSLPRARATRCSPATSPRASTSSRSRTRCEPRSRPAPRRRSRSAAAASTRARSRASRPNVTVRAVEPVAAELAPSEAGVTIAHGRRAQSATARAPARARAEVRQGRPDLRRRPARSRRVARPAERRFDRDAAHAVDHARDPDRLRGDGHRHRGAPRDRARARGRHRDHPPQPLDRGSGRRGRQGQAQRVGDDRRAGDAAARRARVGRARPDAHVPHQRRADHRTATACSSASSRTATCASRTTSRSPSRR